MYNVGYWLFTNLSKKVVDSNQSVAQILEREKCNLQNPNADSLPGSNFKGGLLDFYFSVFIKKLY